MIDPCRATDNDAAPVAERPRRRALGREAGRRRAGQATRARAPPGGSLRERGRRPGLPPRVDAIPSPPGIDRPVIRAPAVPGSWLLPLALGGLGAALRLWQYATGASLWADEANLALNLVDRPLPRLLAPLDYRQVAPPGWLLLQKAIVWLLGEGEHALRLLPLLGSLAALPLSWHVARRVLPAGAGPALVLGLVGTGVPFVFFAAQVKPYATDVAVALGLLALALAVEREGPAGGRLLRLAVAGTVAPWFSYPAVLVDAGLLAALAMSALLGGDRERIRPLVPLALAWAASAGGTVAWVRGTVTPDDVEYMRRFWARWFMPVPPRTWREVGWPVARLTTVYGGGGLRYPAPGVFLALAALGAVTLWRRARGQAWLLLGPVAATFGAAALQAYPFAPRLVLFLFPAFLVMTAAGTEALGRTGGAAGRRGTLAAAALCAGLALLGLLRDPPPYAPEPLKAVLDPMRGAWQPGDRVYVYYGAEKAFVYYARRHGRARDTYVLGRCAREDPRLYLRELDALRGAPRVWVVVAHAALGEDAIILGYLDRIGARRASLQARGRAPGAREPDVARADLYDLSDPRRLAGATWATFPVPARPSSGQAAWSCHPGA
jgi:hypothetical protein